MNTENTADRVLKIIAGGPSFAIQSARQALEDAARSLETIAELAGRDETLLEPDQVRGYAASRAYMARVALATPEQPQPASAEAIPAEQAAPTDPEWPKLDKPASIGGGSFGKGVSSRLLVEAAQRLYERNQAERTKTPEERVADEVNRRALWEMLHGPLAAHPHEAAPTELDERRKCRDCADFGPTCPNTGEPCEGEAADRSAEAARLVYALCEDIEATLRADTDFDRGMRTAAKRIRKEVLAALGTPAAAEPTGIYHEGVNIERLQQACRAFGLRTDDSMEAFVSGSVFADHCNRLTSAVIKRVLPRPATEEAGDALDNWHTCEESDRCRPCDLLPAAAEPGKDDTCR